MSTVRTMAVTGALVLGGALSWVPGTGAGAGDLYLFTYASHGRGVNAAAGQLSLDAGLATSVTNYVLEAGSSFGWHHHENNAQALVISAT